MELRGKNAIVTGGARGIGRGIVLKLAEAGCNVAVVDIGSVKDPALTYNLAAQTDLNDTVEAAAKLGVKAVPILADVTRAKDCARMASEAAAKLGGIDILVNNAGIIALGTVAEMSEESWDRVLAVNAKGVFLCSKACIPYLRKNKEGAILNTASIAGKRGYANLSAYCASKFAVVAITQALAQELGPFNIRVNAVCPGFLKTAMFTEVLNKALVQQIEARESEVFEIYARNNTWLGREQTPADIGDAVIYLARADNVTGVALNVAGGAEVH